MDNSSVKKNISRLREASGISQTDMAESLGISRTAYRNIEKGGTKLISESLDKIASILGKTPEEVVLGYNPSWDGSRKVSDIMAGYAAREKQMTDEYEAEIARLKGQIDSLQEHLADLRETVRTKDEVISMLKRQIQSK